MIIVSQDKRRVINLEKLNYIQVSKVDEKKSIIEINYSDCNYLAIAEYETAERAKEVLQEIIAKYRQYNLDANNSVTVLPKIYEMPKE